MACELIDVHKYAPWEKRPEIPKEPVCVPYVPLELKKTSSLLADLNIILFLVIYGIVLPIIATRFLPLSKTYRYDMKAMGIFAVGSCIVIFIHWGIYKLTKYYLNTKITDPCMKMTDEPYQRYILNKDDPHFLKHLEHYKEHGTWILPREGYLNSGGSGAPDSQDRAAFK